MISDATTIRRFDRPDEVALMESELFGALSREGRYLWSIDVTVLQHLALCATIARREELPEHVVRACAAHDLQEAYLRDLPSGLKDLLPDYRKIELLWEESIFRRMIIPRDRWTMGHVFRIDQSSLLAEMCVRKHLGYVSVCEEVGRAASPEDVEDFTVVSSTMKMILWDNMKRILHPCGGIVWDL